MFCSYCGGQVETTQGNAQPNVVIDNANIYTNAYNNTVMRFGNPKNKWIALLLCLFLGVIGGHKFYEGKAGMGILYF